MTKILASAQQKGGVGKTTLSTNVATALTTHQKGVLLVDADMQGSAMDWASMNDEYHFPTVQICRGDIGAQINLMVETGNYDYVVVDCAPRNEKELASIIKVADLIIMPCMPSPLDIWACDSIVDAIKTRQHLTDKPKAAFLLNGTHPLSNIQADILEAMKEYDLPLLDSVIAARTSYRRIINQGKSVIHSEDEKASGEIERLTVEIMGMLND